MNKTNLLTISILTLLIANTLASTVARAEWDNAQYLNYKGDPYLIVGTGNLGLSYDLKSFTTPQILDNWIYKPLADEFDINSNLSTRLSAVDFIHGVTEGNISWNKITKKWILTNNFLSHIEPSGTWRSDIRLGALNVGLTSTNCYIDRPADTVINPVCEKVFSSQNTNEYEVDKFSDDKKREFFFDNKLTLLLSNYKAITVRKYAKILMDHIESVGMGNQSTSIKLYYIDQINQLGLEGAKKLVSLDKKYLDYSKERLLAIFRELGITSTEAIPYNKTNGTFDLKNYSTDIIRLILARTQYFNAANSDDRYDTQQQWIKDLARNAKLSEAQLMSGDALRRYLLLPQSIEEFSEMESDGYRMDYELKRLFKIN